KGTIYLYYRNKEELQVGIMLRAIEMMNEGFAKAVEKENLGIKKIMAIGDAYWSFAAEHPFHFGMMCNADFPMRDQISDELLAEMNEQNNWVWRLLIGTIEEGKAEGTIKAEVDSFSSSLLSWLNSMSVLRMYEKVQENQRKGSIAIQKQAFNFCSMDFRKVYDLSLGILMSHIVTPEGAKYLQPIYFPSMAELGISPGTALDDMNVNADLNEKIIS
ncbi:MAG: TetR/AcrR family transcriptional regulator, partial [Bacteroidota bacterium]|nr:TetR/AcrR family transcriptional regulator [Bacteroidota bacterium]